MLEGLGSPPRGPIHHQDQSTFKWALKWSAAFHGALFLAAILQALVFPGTPILLTPSLRVDLVDLPDVLKKDLKTPGKTAETAPPEKTVEKPIEKTVPAPHEALPQKVGEMALTKVTPQSKKPALKDNRISKMKSALDRMKALDKIHAEVDAESINNSHDAPLIKGNKISKGTSIDENAKPSDQASYTDLIRDRLQENWALPAWLSRQTLSARVQIWLDTRGNVRQFRFAKSSGNPQFDDAVKKTLQESQPFPIPPTNLSGDLLSNGILIGFPL